MAYMRFVMVLEQRIHPNFFLCYTYLYPLLFAQSTKPTLALPHTLVLSIDLCFFFTLFRFSISNGRRHHQRLFTDRTAVTTSLTSTLSQKKHTFDSLPHRHRTHDALPHRRQHDWLLAAHSAPHSHKANTLHV